MVGGIKAAYRSYYLLMESTVPKRDKVMFGLDYIFRGPSGGPIQYMILQLGMV